jgi:hypothetical protein
MVTLLLNTERRAFKDEIILNNRLFSCALEQAVEKPKRKKHSKRFLKVQRPI